jgi:hypothetical protein
MRADDRCPDIRRNLPLIELCVKECQHVTRG